MKVQRVVKTSGLDHRTYAYRSAQLTPLACAPDHPFLQLQQTVGNQAVQALLRSRASHGKLTANHPGDEYEREAKPVVAQVMLTHDPASTKGVGAPRQARNLRVQRMCSECEEELDRQPIEEEGEILQTKELPDQTTQLTPGVEANIDALRGGGQPLPRSVRAFFEPRFGYDFSQVRVHTEERAANSARAMNARAFTIGRDIMFGAGQYMPGTTAGQRLLAHELTHVAQQHEGGPIIQRYEVKDCDPAENPLEVPSTVHDAHARALSMLTNAISKSSNTSDPAVQRAASQYFRITVPPRTPQDTRLWNRAKRALATMSRAHANAMYECEPRQTWWHGGCIAGNIAISLTNIHLCPLWWTRYTTVNERAAILLHEWGHKWGEGINRVFETYCWEPKYSTLPGAELVSMPDTYASYAYELYTGTQLSC